MARTAWHEETWSEVVNIVREHFTEAGFEVHTNTNAGTISIINRDLNKVLEITDTTLGPWAKP